MNKQGSQSFTETDGPIFGENLNTIENASSGFCGRWTDKSCVSAIGTSAMDLSTMSEYPGGNAEGAYI